MSDSLTVRNQSNITMYDQITDPIHAIEKMGKWFAESGMFGVSKPEQGYVLAMACFAEKKTPLEISRTYHIIKGKLSMKADAMHAEFIRRGGRVRWDKSTDEECVATFFHPEFAPDGFVISNSMEDLKRKGVATDGSSLKDMYRKFPRQMLRARTVSEGVRAIDPSINMGAYTPEEVADFDERPSVIHAKAVVVEEKAPEPVKEDPLPTKTSNNTIDAMLTAYAKLGAQQVDLERYCLNNALNPKMEDWGYSEINELRRLYSDIKAGKISLQNALSMPMEEVA